MGGKAAKERRRLERMSLPGNETSATPGKSGIKVKNSPSQTFKTKDPSSFNKNNGANGFRKKEGFKNQGPGGGLGKNDAFTKSVPKGKTPTKAKFTKASGKNVEKKTFKKPKHLKRKLEQTEDETDKEKVLEALRLLDERKKLFSVSKNPAKKQKLATTKTTTATTQKESSNGATKATPRTSEKAKRHIQRVEKSPEEKPAAAILKEDTHPSQASVENPEASVLQEQDAKPTSDGEPDVVTEDEHVSEEKEQVKKGKSPPKSSSNESKVRAEGAKKSSRDDGHGDSYSSDSDDDDGDAHPTKRQRGRGRKGRQDTAKHVEETEQVEKKEKKKPKDLTRRCIGRKALTDFSVGQRYPGKVIYIKPFGVFIDINCHAEAFCHVSRLQDGFVKNPEDIVKIGDEVNARVVEIDRKQRRITVSLQSDERFADELSSAQAKKARDTKREQKMRSKVGDRQKNTCVPSDSSEPRDVRVEKEDAEDTEPTTNDLVDSNGNYLKDESQMTPAELKRARKLQRRAQRRIQQQETDA